MEYPFVILLTVLKLSLSWVYGFLELILVGKLNLFFN